MIILLVLATALVGVIPASLLLLAGLARGVWS